MIPDTNQQLSRGQRGTAQLHAWRQNRTTTKQSKAHRPGPHSRPHVLVKTDLRTSEGIIVKTFREELIAHVGQPNILQAEIIERCVWIKLRIVLMDRKTLAGHEMTVADSNYYLSWCNTLSRLMRQLGITTNSPPKPATPKPSIDEIIAEARSG